MLVYTFDLTLDGVLSAVFDAYFRHQQPDMLIGEGEQMPLFCEETWQVVTTEEKALKGMGWTGETRLEGSTKTIDGQLAVGGKGIKHSPLPLYI